MSNGRRAIARRLVELRSKGGRAVPLALAHVGSRDRETRMRAFEVLRDWGKPTHAPLAIKGLDDPEDTVVVSAIECLVEWNVRASAAKLATLLSASSQLVRAYAIWALGRLQARRYLPRLRDLFLSGKDTVIGSAAAEACHHLTSGPDATRYEKFLAEQLRSKDPEVRAFTANSLVGIADRRNRPRVLKWLRAAERAETRPAIKDVLTANLAVLLDDA